MEIPSRLRPCSIVSPAKNRSLTTSALLVLTFEFFEGLIQGEEIDIRLDGAHVDISQLLPMAFTAGLEASLVTGSLHQDSPHCFGRRAKKMSPAVPVLGFFNVHQSHIGLVNERRRLNRLPRPLIREALRPAYVAPRKRGVQAFRQPPVRPARLRRECV